jgi:hypothetical protein
MLVVVAAALLALQPGRMPPISSQTSNYGAKTNHITSFDDNPPFKGIDVVLEDLGCPDLHRNRIRRHFLDNSGKLPSHFFEHPPSITSITSTANILKAIVIHLACKDAPVDSKEVAESIEFYLRCGKRAIGAARRVLKNSNVTEQSIVVEDICSGHGLTGMLFTACNPPNRVMNASMRVLLVDKSEPLSHSILRKLISDVCPWVNQETVQFVESDLDDYVAESRHHDTTEEAAIILSTHACGSLTDDVIRYAVERKAASVSVMPCCYTGTAKGSPYGVQRAFGVKDAADIRRAFYLHDHDYHVDFAAIPKAITPMNRLIVAERRC